MAQPSQRVAAGTRPLLSVLDAFAQRLVTQMYFPGDPLLPLDPIFNSVPDPEARRRLIARWSLELTQPEWSLGYEWDIVVAGRDATPLHDDGDE